MAEVKDWGPPKHGGGAAEPEEEIRAFAAHLFRWKGPKAKFFLFGTVQGTVAVTNRRLLFLTGGGSWFTSQLTAVGEQLSGGVRLADVDLSQLSSEDSISMRLEDIERFEVIRRWDFAHYLSLRGTDELGAEVCVAFMPKLGLNPSHLREIVATALPGGGKELR